MPRGDLSPSRLASFTLLTAADVVSSITPAVVPWRGRAAAVIAPAAALLATVSFEMPCEPTLIALETTCIM
jgi:hypothetical protein